MAHKGLFRRELSFLSNMYVTRIKVEGITFRCVESAYQAMKFEDNSTNTVKQYFAAMDGYEAKKLANSADLRKKVDWHENKLAIMEKLLELKFEDLGLETALLLTSDKFLVELNTWGDTYYGATPEGKGENHLGRLLRKIKYKKLNNLVDYQDNTYWLADLPETVKLMS